VRRSTVDVGFPLVVREWGESENTLVFWPGLNPFGALALNEAGPAWADDYGLRVISVSPPGMGETPGLASEEYLLSSLADVVVRLLDGLAVDRAAYAGFSWGASIGCHLAARASERLWALALLDAGYDDVPDDGKDLDARIADMRAMQDGFRFPSWDAFFEAAQATRPRWHPALEEQLRAGMSEENGEIVASASAEAAAAAFHGVVVEPPTAELEAVGRSGIPVLLVTSGERAGEGAGRAALDRFSAAVPQAELVHLAESGHDVLADEPEQTIGAVGEFLGRRGP
jgi:pimeloyl-ACP methyl ester carboxylesterase